jgi:hypothetical protein
MIYCRAYRYTLKDVDIYSRMWLVYEDLPHPPENYLSPDVASTGKTFCAQRYALFWINHSLLILDFFLLTSFMFALCGPTLA